MAAQRQERFAREWLATDNRTEALRRAYPNTISWTANAQHVQAHRIAKLPKVLHTIERLRRMAEQVTVETISAELDEARALAKDSGQPGPMVQASLGKAKLHRLIDAPGSTTLNINVTTVQVAPDLARIRGAVDAMHTSTSSAEPPLIEHAAVRSELSD